MEQFWSYTKAFGKFWYYFIVGADWTLAAAVGVSIAIDFTLYYNNIPAWYVIPLLLILALGASTARGSRHR